jgi:hypothetical protein
LAEDSGPKKPKLKRNSPEYQSERARRYTSFRQRLQDTEKARKSYATKQGFGERLLGAYGLGEEQFKKGGFVKGKLGMFAKAMESGQEKFPAKPSTVDTPPDIEKQKTDPKVSTLIDQLDTLLKVAHRVGMVTTEQKNELKSHLSQKARDDEETRMEMRDANAISSITGTNLTPLNEEITTLIEKIKPLQKIVDEKVKEQEKEKGPRGFMQRLAESYGVGDDYDRFSRRRASRKARNAARTNPGYRRVMDRNGRVTYRGPTGAFASASDALVPPKPPSRLSRATGAIGRGATRVGGAGLSAAKSAGSGLLNLGRMGVGAAGRGAMAAGGAFGRGATRVGGAVFGAALNPSTIMRSIAANRGGTRVAGAGISMASGMSSRVSSILGSGFKKAGVAASAARNVSPNVVKRIVKPIITKAIGSTVLKSIPIVGAVAGGLFAAKKLLEGDPVGAGLEAASGLAGPLTAIPAMVASVSRDAYSGIFNVQPEQDPYFGTRMKMIVGIVGGLVAAMLASKVEAKPAPTKNDIDAAVVPPKPPQQMGETPTGTPAPAPPAAPAPSPTPSPPPSSPPPSSPAPSSSPSSSPSRSTSRSTSRSSGNERSASTGLSGVERYMASPEFASALAAETAPTMVSQPPDTGIALDESSRELETAANGLNAVDLTSGGRPLPSTMPPSKRGVSGAGDVPDPNYYGMGIIKSQIDSNPNPVASAV